MNGARDAANIPRCTGHPHNKNTIPPKMCVVLRLRKPGPIRMASTHFTSTFCFR